MVERLAGRHRGRIDRAANGAYRTRLETALPRRDAAAEAAGALASAQAAFESATANLEYAKATVDRLEAVLAQARADGVERARHHGRLEQVRAEMAASVAFSAAAADVERLQLLVTEAQIEAEKATGAVAEAGAAEEAAERRLSSAHASRLAAALAPDAPCPVCGSLDHPAPAAPGEDEAAAIAALRSARAARVAGEPIARAAAAGLARLQGELVAAERRQQGQPAPARAESLIQIELEELETVLAAPVPDVETLADQLARAVEERNTADRDVATGRDALGDAGRVAAAASAALGAALTDIPVELQNPEALERAVLAAEHELEEQRRRHLQAQAAERHADQTLRQARADHDRTTLALVGLRAERDERAAEFEAALAAAKLSGETYVQARGDIDNLEHVSAAIEAIRTAATAAAARLAAAGSRVGEATRPDLACLQAEADAADARLTEAERNHTAAEQSHAALVRTQADLVAKAASIAAQASDFEVVGELAALTDGRNAQRMKLRDFAIIATFEDVLNAANLRFARMSGGRYQLLRKQERGDGRASSGLEVEVFDSHTDQRRDAHTLSGGEGFLASLSLALGLSDVVQAETGGVKLDAIFIDEGFGHLDDETLDMALITLRDLVGQDRSVGVISHVEAVKQQIPNGFEVERGMRGSRIRERRLS